jgi:hypothetical protein
MTEYMPRITFSGGLQNWPGEQTVSGDLRNLLHPTNYLQLIPLDTDSQRKTVIRITGKYQGSVLGY